MMESAKTKKLGTALPMEKQLVFPFTNNSAGHPFRLPHELPYLGLKLA
jgi:hypothetical protein